MVYSAAGYLRLRLLGQEGCEEMIHWPFFCALDNLPSQKAPQVLGMIAKFTGHQRHRLSPFLDEAKQVVVLDYPGTSGILGSLESAFVKCKTDILWRALEQPSCFC